MSSGLRGVIRGIGRQPWFAKLGKAIVPVDRAIQLATRGRLTATGVQVVPQLLLTVTGRKSGRPRTTPLLYIRDGEDFMVFGSNWGDEHHPAWTANLLADPDAVVTLKGRRIPVKATLLDGAERDRIWRQVLVVWPAYEGYAARAEGRTIRVFRLTPAQS